MKYLQEAIEDATFLQLKPGQLTAKYAGMVKKA